MSKKFRTNVDGCKGCSHLNQYDLKGKPTCDIGYHCDGLGWCREFDRSTTKIIKT